VRRLSVAERADHPGGVAHGLALAAPRAQWLDPTRLRLPYPVNPGWHTFLVESNGEVLAARRVYFEEGQNRVVPLSGWHAPSAATTAPIAIAPEHAHGVVVPSTGAPSTGAPSTGMPSSGAESDAAGTPRKLSFHPSAAPSTKAPATSF
jgi:hypothetical protein